MGLDAIPYLSSMLTHPDKYVRRNAVWALGKLGPLAKVAVPAICAALKDADPRTASGGRPGTRRDGGRTPPRLSPR